MVERYVNIFWEPDEDEPTGHVSVFRARNSEHEADLMKPNEFSTSIVAIALPLACPIVGTGVKPDFLERSGFVCSPAVDED